MVTEEGNSRITIYSSASSKSNGANADNVLAQSDFTTSGSGLSDSFQPLRFFQLQEDAVIPPLVVLSAMVLDFSTVSNTNLWQSLNNGFQQLYYRE